MRSFLTGKKILLIGGTGTIGAALFHKLIDEGVRRQDITVASMDREVRAQAVLGEDLSIYRYTDIRDYQTCVKLMKGQEIVFQLTAVKGNTQIGVSKVATQLNSFLRCNANTLEAACNAGVERFLFVGSICEYPNLEMRAEDDVWKGLPSANDRYAGVAKRVGEMQAEALYQETGWDAVRIVRPSNVYGPFDNFNPRTAQVIPSLIHKLANSNGKPVEVAGDGSAVRDFIYTEDVAEGMLEVLEKAPPCYPINLGSGKGYSIRETVETIAANFSHKTEIVWNTSKPTGDRRRILDVNRARETIGFTPRFSLSEGIQRTVSWYLSNRQLAVGREEELKKL